MTHGITVGFVGVGAMGEPICRHLARKSGARVIAFDRATEPLQRLTAEGVQTGTLEQIARSSDFIFLSLPSGEVVESVVLGEVGLAASVRSGSTVVDLSTTSVDTSLRLNARLGALGVHFADAPVMRTRTAAEAGTLAVPVGADDATFDAIELYLHTFGTDVMHCGGVGAGQCVKILNNMVLYETVVALSEACAIARRRGMDPEKLLNALAAGSADSFALRHHGFKAILPGEFPLRTFPMSYARKDVQYAVELAQSVGVDASGARNLLECLDQAIAAGHGDKYAPAVSLIF